MKIIINYWKEIVIVILIACLATSMRTCDKRNQTISFLETAYKDTIYQERTKKGELISKVETLQATVEDVKKYADQLGVDNKSLKQRIGSLNNLVAFYKGKIEVRDTVKVPVVDTVYIAGSDTVQGKAFDYDNGFLSLNGVVSDFTAKIDYSYRVGFEMTTYYSRSGFLKLRRGPMMTDLKFADPHVTMENFNAIVIQEPLKKFWEKPLVTFFIGLGVGVIVPAFIPSQ